MTFSANETEEKVKCDISSFKNTWKTNEQFWWWVWIMRDFILASCENWFDLLHCMSYVA